MGVLGLRGLGFRGFRVLGFRTLGALGVVGGFGFQGLEPPAQALNSRPAAPFPYRPRSISRLVLCPEALSPEPRPYKSQTLASEGS